MNYIKVIEIIDKKIYITVNEQCIKNFNIGDFATKIFNATRVCFDLEMFKAVFEDYTVIQLLEITREDFLKICNEVKKSFYQRKD